MSALKVALRMLGLCCMLTPVHAVRAQTPPPSTTAPASTSVAPEVEETRSPASSSRPVFVHAELLGGVLLTPTPGNRWAAFMDRYGGVRAGVGKEWKGITVAAETALRVTPFSSLGKGQLVPPFIKPFMRLAGAEPYQTLRQSTQLALGGALSYRLRLWELFLEPMVLGGVSGSAHFFAVGLGRPLPYNLSFPTLGGYLGAALQAGLEPVYLRLDMLFMNEWGPPPFTTIIPQYQYNIGMGVRF